MISKAEILERSNLLSLQPTTIQKDYVIGWILRSISKHTELSKWIFKGGTCLKKCYFETYRFSEDLDFTVPTEQNLSIKNLQSYFEVLVSWIEENSGLTFPRQERTHWWPTSLSASG